MSDTAIKRPAGVTIVGILTAILGVINIVFGFFHFDSGGAAQIVINLIVVLIVNTHKAKLWFSQTA